MIDARQAIENQDTEEREQWNRPIFENAPRITYRTSLDNNFMSTTFAEHNQWALVPTTAATKSSERVILFYAQPHQGTPGDHLMVILSNSGTISVAMATTIPRMNPRPALQAYHV